MADTRPRHTTLARTPVPEPERITRVERRATTLERVQGEHTVTLANHETRIGEAEATLDAMPEPALIWSSDRPASQFGTGPDLLWSFTGDGSTSTYNLSGRLTANPHRYRVTVGAVPQTPGTAYSLPTDSPSITFASPPPAGTAIRVFAPFYGAAPT